MSERSGASAGPDAEDESRGIDHLAAVRCLLWLASLSPVLAALEGLGAAGRAAGIAGAVAYFVACLAAYVMTTTRPAPASRLVARYLPVVDVAVYAALVSLLGVREGTLVCGLLFSVALVAASFGTAVGAAAAVLCGALSSLAEIVAHGPTAGATRVATGSAVFAALGCAVAAWVGTESRARRRAAFLRAVSDTVSSRVGVDRTLGLLLEQVRAHTGADTCMLVMTEAGAEHHTLRRADRDDPERAAVPDAIAPELASQLLSESRDRALVYGQRGLWPWPGGRTYAVALDAKRPRPMPLDAQELERLAGLLDAASFVSAPVRGFGAGGMLCVTWAAPRRVGPDLAAFLLRVVNSSMPVLENLRLAERSVSEAAERERRRLALDLHDMTIQPFIGLQLGLEAVRRKLDAGDEDVSEDISKLLRLTETEIDDLRGHVTELRESDTSPAFLDAVDRFVKKFEGATGIAVDLSVGRKLRLSKPLAVEALHLVAEALSNVRRHTQSDRAHVRLECADGAFILQVANDTTGTADAFTPRSISERAAALGGRIKVTHTEDGATRLDVTIPL